MDKAKEIWGFVKRQHFWILAPLLFIVGLIGWYLATSKLNKEFAENQSAVQGYISTMNTVGSNNPHPNQEYLDGMQQLIESRRENVRKAWQTKWENQKQRLRWPEGLDADFLKKVEPMRPIESVGPGQDDQLLGIQRRQYVNFVKTELPRLAQAIGAKWEPAKVASSSFSGEGFRAGAPRAESRGGNERAVAEEGNEEAQVVTWNPQNQGEFEARLVSQYEEIPPNTRQILYAQEDLWVLESIIDIIKRTNADAMTRSQAVVKEIRYIKIGKDVPPPSMTAFRVLRPGPLAGEGEAEAGAEAGAPAPEVRSEEPVPGAVVTPEGGSPEGMPQAPPDRIALIVNQRYYDEKYEPIADLETLKANAAVAKRIPVRLMVLMDQRRMNRLLVEAANAPLTFEVRQLRFNPTDSGGTTLGGFGARAEGGGFGGGQSRVRTLDDYQSFDRWIELFGIIYIFNPVNEALLNGEAAPAAEASGGSA